MNWDWLVEQGLIKGNPTYYASGQAQPAEVQKAITEAYNKSDDTQRKTLVDMAWASGTMEGDKSYWYTKRPNEVEDFATAFSGYATENIMSGQERADFNDADTEARFLGLPGKPEVWKNSETGKLYLMYPAYSSDPPVPLLFNTTDDELQAFFGEGVTVVIDRNVTSDDVSSVGGVVYGDAASIDMSEGDPWIGFKVRIENAKDVQPWLLDPEVLAITAGAYLEGRNLYDWELERTEWYQGLNDPERAWMKLAAANPSQAETKIQDDQSLVRSLFDKIGAEGTDAALIDFMAKQFSIGSWSQTYLTEQVEAAISGNYDMDVELTNFIEDGGIELVNTKQKQESVRSLWNDWLGPAYQPSEADVEKWATVLRTSGDGREELISMLRGQRMALYSEYEDPNLTYSDIAAPWKNVVFNTLGETADETSEMFQSIIRMNDYGEANKVLRRKGLDEGNDKVWADATSATGSSVRRAV